MSDVTSVSIMLPPTRDAADIVLELAMDADVRATDQLGVSGTQAVYVITPIQLPGGGYEVRFDTTDPGVAVALAEQARARQLQLHVWEG